MNDLLIRLGKRVQELRAGKKWSQEEFAHISGLHRTYIGQIERGEKNISFENLSKIAVVLGVTLSEMLAGVEDGSPSSDAVGRAGREAKLDEPSGRIREIQKLVRRLKVQRGELDRTALDLEELVNVGNKASSRSPRRRTRAGSR